MGRGDRARLESGKAGSARQGSVELCLRWSPPSGPANDMFMALRALLHLALYGLPYWAEWAPITLLKMDKIGVCPLTPSAAQSWAGRPGS